MNNQQFRRLLDSTPDEQTTSPAGRSVLGGRRPAARKPQNEFSQSVRERSVFLQPKKRFKSSDPKGSKLAAGYVDRARARTSAADTEAGDKAERVSALEEQLKNGEVSQEEFETLREEITGGDIASTHLVKGLDRRLLERVRRGENVMGSEPKEDSPDDEVDEELDKIEETEVQRVETLPSHKQGNLAPGVLAGMKRTRDDIMAELRAQRSAAAKARIEAEPALDSRWRRIDEKQKSRIEIDRKGREVLVIVDEDGIVKKKVRRSVPVEDKTEEQVIGRNVAGAVLGADVVIPVDLNTSTNAPTIDSDDDIFEGVGADYNPLGEDDTGSSGEDESREEDESAAEDQSATSNADTKAQHSQKQAASDADPLLQRSRNYFNDIVAQGEKHTDARFAGVEAVIAKAARLAAEKEEAVQDDHDPAAAQRRAKHAAMLANQDRDLDDMDLGFGGSRLDDGEDEDTGKGIRLSEWNDPEEKGTEKKRDTKRRAKNKAKTRPA